MAVATSGSPNTVPHSPTLRLEVTQHRTPLVAPRSELEEQMGCVAVERKIAKHIDSEQLGLGEKCEQLPYKQGLRSLAFTPTERKRNVDFPASAR